MSTRRLILTALLCGIAIVVAGGIKLLQVANEDAEIVVLALGTSSTLGDMTVSVDAVDQSQSGTDVTVTMRGVDGADATEGWRMLAGGKVEAPTGTGSTGLPGRSACTFTSAAGSGPCVVSFPASEGTVTIAYLRAGGQSQWSAGP
ncbi:MAG: hypothetical protein ACKORY_01265 [Actinomycetota bacterium]